MIQRITFKILFLFLPFLSFSQWSQLGNDITGMAGDRLGHTSCIDIDASGQTIAIGSPFNSDNGAFSGYAEVYDFDGSQWNLRGNRIEGMLPDTEGTGAAVSLSEDGMTLAVGHSHGLNSLGYRCGVVSVLDWDGSAWILRGEVIEGEGNPSPLLETDVFGSALSLSADGNFLAVGAGGNTPEAGVLQISGHARIYQWDGSEWLQMGQDIDGLTSLEEFGYAVKINDAGNLVAISGRSQNTPAQSAGYVRIFEWNGTDWQQRGDAFTGTGVGETLGSSLGMSSDGNTISMGARNAASSTNPGYVKIFDWDGTSWIQRGETIEGETTDQTGASCDMSADGNIVVIGEPWANSVYGQVRVFMWDGSSWEQIDNAIAESGAPGSLNSFGNTVAISADGSTVVVGAPGFDLGTITQEGQVNVFKNQTLVSVENLELSEISFYPNPTSHSLSIQSLDEIENLEIINVAGKKISSMTGIGRKYELDMSNLSAGCYFITIKLREKIQTIKVFKID